MAEFTVNNFNQLVLKSQARDRIGMFFQYSARVIMGLISIASPTSGSRLLNVEELCRNIFTNLSAARRTQRWCKEIPVIQSIPQCLSIADPIDRVLEVVTKASLAGFYILDHIGGLKQWKVLTGGKRAGTGTIQLGLKVLLVYCIAAITAQTKKLAEGVSKWEDRKKSIESVVENIFLACICSHLGLVYELHDVLCGVSGIGYAIIKLKAQWALIPDTPPKKILAAGYAENDDRISKRW